MAAEKSNKRKRTSCNFSSSSSSSESDADPDYTLSLSKKPTTKASTMRGKHKFSIKKKDKLKQKEIPIRKTSKISTKNMKSEDAREEHREFSICRNGNGKRKKTKKKAAATILSWLIESKAIQENTQVFIPHIDDHNNILKKGILKKDGILCFCCNKFFTATGFSFHGGRRINNPYENIFTLKNHNISLFFGLLRAWHKPEESALRRFNSIETTQVKSGDVYDDACMICADGGNLMCCEECNSTYHQSCMCLKVIFKARTFFFSFS